MATFTLLILLPVLYPSNVPPTTSLCVCVCGSACVRLGKPTRMYAPHMVFVFL